MAWSRPLVQTVCRTVPQHRVPFWRGQMIAVAAVAAATALRTALDPVLSGSPFITFLPAVLIAGIWGGTRSGVTTLLLSGLVSTRFWVDPIGAVDLNEETIWKATAFLVFGGLILAVSATLRELVVALASAEERSRILAAEMKHRISNIISTANAVSRQTAQSAASLEDHVRLFEARMMALGRSQDLAMNRVGEPLDLRALLTEVLAPFDLERFSLFGPICRVPDKLATALALSLNELGTNALKYGSLSRPEGRVDLRWTSEGERVVLAWRETGGPRVAQPVRTGFGSRLMGRGLSSLGAQAEMTFAPDGLVCQITFEQALCETEGSADRVSPQAARA